MPEFIRHLRVGSSKLRVMDRRRSSRETADRTREKMTGAQCGQNGAGAEELRMVTPVPGVIVFVAGSPQARQTWVIPRSGCRAV